jgi:hypothetical protein
MTPPAPPLRLQIAFLNGQSDPRGAALSPVQAAFLTALPAPPEWKVWVNFPYPPATPPHRRVALARASWNNARQVLGARRPAFAERHRAPVEALLARAETTLLLAGSCGLELLGRLGLGTDRLARLRVFAYGAVAWRRPDCAVRQVRGRGDWISRLGSGVGLAEGDAWVAGGHLAYLADPRVLALCAEYLREVAAGGR